MKNKNLLVLGGVVLCCAGMLNTSAATLNEWSFERDVAGLMLSQASNSGPASAVFSSGGAGFLETDGAGSLLCIHPGDETNGMWSSGAILNADVPDVTSGVHYIRYDCSYDLTSSNFVSGLASGLSVIDSSGTNVAGLVLIRGDAEAPPDRELIGVQENLPLAGYLSAIAKVDMDTKTMSVWYSLTRADSFDESQPAVSNVPIFLTSIDQLQFQATGDFRPAGSSDYIAADNLRTASTWADISSLGNIPLTVHPLFYNNMVLQRDMDVPVWGHVTPGATVTVQLDGIPAGTAVADAAGRWQATIGPHSNDGGLPHVVLISSPSEQDIQINEVVFGDVYLASGQSNMDYTMNYASTTGFTGYAEEVAGANAYPLIRQVSIFRTNSITAQAEPLFRSKWTKCSSSSLPTFTAVGYWFAKNVYLETGVPVGLIACAWYGQVIERFLCPEGLTAVPELSGLMQYQEQGSVPNLYDIYNAMIAPLIPYGVRGAIWYQGEYNSTDGNIYRNKMQALMRGWRQNWGQGDFPFHYVQLANFQTDYSPIREAQTMVLSETNTGMAVTIDIGDIANIHPANKPDVGRRLAQWTLAKDLHRPVVFSGPLFRKAIIEGSQIRIIFDYAESGLITGWKDSTNPVVAVSGPLQNFEIAGADKTFVAATATIDKDSVLVSSALVSDPVYVRYCYTNSPSGTNKLYNTAELPASPFRTDKSYRLDVKSGSGTIASITEGTTVNITAAAPASGNVFDRWIGAASEIDNLNASPATLTMPAHSLYLLATYRDTTAPAYTLTVNNGFGDGTSQSGSILNIEADVPPAGQLFDHWSGDTQTVVNVYESGTTLRMPTNNVTVTAVYRTIDSVGDGVADTWRALYFSGDGTTTNNQSAASADPDGDGLSNEQEYNAGTSPLDNQSVLRLDGSFAGHAATLNFLGVAGHRYALETTDSLSSPEWRTVFYNIVSDENQKLLDFDTGGVSNGFYRLRLNDN